MSRATFLPRKTVIPKMLSLGRIIKRKNSTSLTLSLLHTSAPDQHHSPTRRDPNTSHYDTLIAEAGKARNFPRLRHLLIERINHNSFNSRDTFNFITKTESSITSLDKVFECLAGLPKGSPRRSAYASFVKRLCTLGLLENALQVLDKMRKRKLELNATTYHPVIKTLTTTRNDVAKALKVMQGMRRNRIVLDTTTYNYLLMQHCMKRELVHADEVLKMMKKEKGVKGDSRTYEAMVIGVCRAGNVEGTIAILRAAVDDGVAIMQSTYEFVVKALLEAGFYEQGLKFLLCFAGKNKRLDGESFNVLANGLIKLERLDEAKMVVEEMKKRGLFLGKIVEEFCQLHGLD